MLGAVTVRGVLDRAVWTGWEESMTRTRGLVGPFGGSVRYYPVLGNLSYFILFLFLFISFPTVYGDI